MAYHKPQDLDGFMHLMGKPDMRIRAQLAEDLVAFLSDPLNSIECSDLGMLVDNLVPWMNGSHFKIAQRALEAATELISRLEHDFIAYVSTVLPHVVERLGDNKEVVRENAQLLIQKLMECRVLQPQTLVDKISTNCFKHKNAKVREEFLQTIVNTLNVYGTQSLSVKTYIAPIVALLGDPTAVVRDAAHQTLIEIYKHVGDRLRADLRKKDVPPAKLQTIEQKFDEVRRDGLLLPSATSGTALGDDVDNATMPRPSKLVKRTVSATPRKFGGDSVAPSSAGEAGAVSAEVFEASFELVPSLTIFAQRDMDELWKQTIAIVGDKTQDWEKRVDALKKIRSLLIMNIQANPNFTSQLKDLSIAYLDILKELRSQVIREACITLAYMSKTLRNKLDHFSVYILQELINLIQNAAKVIASSGTVALKYIIRYTHVPKLVPIITQNLLQSKSKDIRAALSEILMLLFEEWPTKALEKNSILLRDALKKGISDADSEARKYSRRAFWGFHKHFPDLADNLFGSLDPPTQRSVNKESDSGGIGSGAVSMSASLRGSNSSLNSMPGGVLKRRQSSGLRSPASTQPSVASTSTSTENLAAARLTRAPSLPRSYTRNRSGIPVAHREPVYARPTAGFRSVSAVDTAAAQRARARAQYSNMARLKISSGHASLPRAKKLVAQSATPSQASPERQIRSRGVSQSQPTSRSTSPSSRIQSVYSAYRQTGAVPKKTSGIPRSLANSRETSPTRIGTGANQFGSLSRRNMYSASSTPRRPPVNPPRPVMAQKMLQQSLEAENEIANKLGGDHDLSADFSRLAMHRKLGRDESDESEASSVCSERSFDSYRRGGEPFSWNGSRSRLDNSRVVIEDIETIIQFCGSTHWTERKDGLMSLIEYLSQGRILASDELTRVLDLFRKMFMDPHVKVYTLFLDALNEVILAHSNDLHNWLFTLLGKLFIKLGTDLLGSMVAKIWKTLDLCHEYFPGDLQMHCVFKILCDNISTPNLKTKLATVKFLSDLAQKYCKPTEFITIPPADKAISKVIQYALDQKSLELRSTSRVCIVQLYNCNTPSMTMILTSLPKQFQDAAKNFISSHLRRSNSGTNSPSSPLSCVSPKPVLSPQQGGPYSLQIHPSPRSRQTSVETESVNSEEVYKNLRKTTAEIQNYSYESKLDRDANSKDSGISQMGDPNAQIDFLSLATNGYNGHGFGLDAGDSCNGSKTQSATTTESNTPENTVRLDGIDGGPRYQQAKTHNFTLAENGEIFLTDKNLKETEIVQIAIKLTMNDDTEFIVQALSNLSICIKYGNGQMPSKNFKNLLKMILNFLQAKDSITVIAALETLGKIMRSEGMRECWTNFLELIIIKFIDSYKTSKEVSREIDVMIPKLARAVPLEPTVAILNPVIATGEFPTNLCALKFLTEITESQGQNITEDQLDQMMPHIARLTEDHQSMVRKAAVFCIVKLYFKMGEEKVKPKLALLNSSKVRLLNVYISKQMGTAKTTS